MKFHEIVNPDELFAPTLVLFLKKKCWLTFTIQLKTSSALKPMKSQSNQHGMPWKSHSNQHWIPLKHHFCWFNCYFHIWLVVWNIVYEFPFSWECHHPNWRTQWFFRGVGRYTTNQIWFLVLKTSSSVLLLVLRWGLHEEAELKRWWSFADLGSPLGGSSHKSQVVTLWLWLTVCHGIDGP